MEVIVEFMVKLISVQVGSLIREQKYKSEQSKNRRKPLLTVNKVKYIMEKSRELLNR